MLRGEHRLALLCHIAGVHKSGYYAWEKGASKRMEKRADDALLAELIRTTCGKYLGKWGSRQVTMQISTLESKVNHKRVERVMREHGLLSKRRSVNPYKNIPKESSEIEIAENIMSRKYAFDTLWPFRVFGTDITFLRIAENKWAYLSAVKDFCTGEIVAHETSLNPNTELVLATLNIFAANVPLEARLGGLMHSDRGSTYTSKAHCNMTRSLGLNVSMSRKGNCIDNAPTESFFGHMKDELPNTRNMPYEELRKTIDGYIIDHNTVRKQWHREKMSPVEYREHLLCA